MRQWGPIEEEGDKRKRGERESGRERGCGERVGRLIEKSRCERDGEEERGREDGVKEKETEETERGKMER